MQKNPDRPAGQNVENPNESEKELHVDPRFVAYPNLEQDNIERVK